MFGRQNEKIDKKKGLPPMLWLKDAQLRTLYHDRLDQFPFPEAVIVAASKEFFNDPAPCEIHRRAVQLRLCAEIMEMLPADQLMQCEELHPVFLQYFEAHHPAFVQLGISQ